MGRSRLHDKGGLSEPPARANLRRYRLATVLPSPEVDRTPREPWLSANTTAYPFERLQWRKHPTGASLRARGLAGQYPRSIAPVDDEGQRRHCLRQLEPRQKRSSN